MNHRYWNLTLYVIDTLLNRGAITFNNGYNNKYTNNKYDKEEYSAVKHETSKGRNDIARGRNTSCYNFSYISAYYCVGLSIFNSSLLSSLGYCITCNIVDL